MLPSTTSTTQHELPSHTTMGTSYLENRIKTTPYLYAVYRTERIKGYVYTAMLDLPYKGKRDTYFLSRSEQDKNTPYFRQLSFDHEYTTWEELEQDVRKHQYPGVDLEARDWLCVVDPKPYMPDFAWDDDRF